MNIINNQTDNNHKKELLKIFTIADEVIIVSPFLSSNFLFFPFNKIISLKKITLITTLKPNSNDQIDKVNFFDHLFKYGKKNRTKIEILIDNTLHGKIYFSKKGDEYINAIITSANFTANGLEINNEWGVIFTEKKEINEIANNLFNNIVFEEITKKDIRDFKNKIKDYPHKKEKEKIKLKLIESLRIKRNPLNLSNDINYWFKPVGVKEEPIEWGRSFEDIETKLHFSDKYPRSVKKGDILILYAVSYKNILSIYRVISEIKKTIKKNNRWPYYVVGKNLTPYFGSKWFKYNITISNQREEVLTSKYFKITPSGKNSYGSLMRGADKLKITNDFANYLINKITRINNDIATKTNM